MLTDAANGANAPPRAVMLSIADIARRDQVAKPTVSIAVKRLVEQHGLTVERDGQGRVSAVNVAQYDHLRGRYGDPSKAQAPPKSEPAADATAEPEARRHSDGYDEALRQKTWIDAETKRLALNELRGNLVRRDRMEEALLLCAEKIARPFDQLPQAADELADAYEKGGLHGLRQALKELSRKWRIATADALESGIAAEPVLDDPLPFTEANLL